MKLITRTEELMLLSVLHLKDEAYCVPIYDYLNNVTEKKWTFGNIYGPLYRLEQSGYLESYLGQPSSERGGKSKRYYKVTSKGLKALQEVRTLQEKSWAGIPEFAIE